VIDLDGPIFPGVGAAGIALGMAARDVLEGNIGTFRLDFRGRDEEIHESEHVSFWSRVSDGLLTRIELHGGFRGTVYGTIRLGSTLVEVEAHLGRVEQDGDDVLVVRQIPGLGFETEPWSEGRDIARVTGIFVFPVR
jgi:hypothetical protein